MMIASQDQTSDDLQYERASDRIARATRQFLTRDTWGWDDGVLDQGWDGSFSMVEVLVCADDIDIIRRRNTSTYLRTAPDDWPNWPTAIYHGGAATLPVVSSEWGQVQMVKPKLKAVLSARLLVTVVAKIQATLCAKRTAADFLRAAETRWEGAKRGRIAIMTAAVQRGGDPAGLAAALREHDTPEWVREGWDYDPY